MLLRPLIVALVIGTSLAVAATGTVNLVLVASTTLSWIFVVAIQLLAAVAIIGTARARPVSIGRALSSFFALHVPWSSWMLAWAVWTWIATPVVRHSGWAMWTALVPAAWTAILIYRFCRHELGDPHRRALARVVAHQALIWTTFLVIGGAAVSLWPRLLQVLGA